MVCGRYGTFGFWVDVVSVRELPCPLIADDEPFVFEVQVKTHIVSGKIETYVRTTDIDKH